MFDQIRQSTWPEIFQTVLVEINGEGKAKDSEIRGKKRPRRTLILSKSTFSTKRKKCLQIDDTFFKIMRCYKLKRDNFHEVFYTQKETV